MFYLFCLIATDRIKPFHGLWLDLSKHPQSLRRLNYHWVLKVIKKNTKQNKTKMNKLFISSIRERKARQLPRDQSTDKKWRAGWHTSKSVFLAHAQSKALPVETKRFWVKTSETFLLLGKTVCFSNKSWECSQTRKNEENRPVIVTLDGVLEVAVFFRQFFDWQLHDPAITAIAVGSVRVVLICTLWSRNAFSTGAIVAIIVKSKSLNCCLKNWGFQNLRQIFAFGSGKENIISSETFKT